MVVKTLGNNFCQTSAEHGKTCLIDNFHRHLLKLDNRGMTRGTSRRG